MDPEREKLVIQIDVDQAAANRARQAIAAVRADEEKLAESFRKLGPIADTGVDLIEGKFDLLEEQISLARHEARAFETDLDALGASGSAALEQLRRDALAAGEALDSTRGGLDVGRVGGVGSQLLGGIGQGEAAGIVGLVGDAAEALTTLNPAMLALTAAGGAAALVVDQVTQAYQRQIDAAAELAQRQIGIADLVASGATSAEAQAAAAALAASYSYVAQQANDALLAYTEITQRERYPTPGEDANALNDAALERAGFMSLAALEAYVTPIQARLDELRESEQDLLDSIDAGLFAINDQAAEAAANAAAWDDIQAQWLAQMEQAFNADRERLDFTREIDQMTLEQRAEFAANLRERQADLQAAVDTFRGTGWERLPEVEADLAQVNEQLEMLGYVTESTADRLAQSAAAQERYNDLTDDYFQSITDQVDAAAQYQQALTEYNEAIAESAAKIAELRADATADLIETEAKAGKDRVKAQEDLNDRILKAQERFNVDSASAIKARDVEAYQAAEKAREDELKAANEAYKDQIAAIDDRLKEQINTINRRLEEQVRNAQRAADNEVNTKKRALDQADANQQNANRNMLALQQQFQNSEYTIRANAYNALANQAYAAGQVLVGQFTNGVNAALAGAMAGMGGGSGYGGGGGRVAPTPLSVMPRSGGSTTTVNVYSGHDTRTITGISNSQARRVLDEVLRD